MYYLIKFIIQIFFFFLLVYTTMFAILLIFYVITIVTDSIKTILDGLNFVVFRFQNIQFLNIFLFFFFNKFTNRYVIIKKYIFHKNYKLIKTLFASKKKDIQ
jgi:hypothetical protein